jgi:hypothetical protein
MLLRPLDHGAIGPLDEAMPLVLPMLVVVGLWGRSLLAWLRRQCERLWDPRHGRR